jgi:hypothetical protein
MQVTTIPVDQQDALEALLAETFGDANDEGDLVAYEQDDEEEEGEEAARSKALIAQDPDDEIYEVAEDLALADLDALLAESVKQRNEAQVAKAAKDRLRKGGQSARERAEDQARLQAWEAAHEWVARANVAYFERAVCACGQEASLFIGLMQRREHRHLKATMDWILVQAATANLPNEVARRTRHVNVCMACAPQKGWQLAGVVEWEDR